MCRAVILVLLLSLPSTASAAVLSLYSPFDTVHNGVYGRSHPSAETSAPVSATKRNDVTGSVDVFGGCGRGRTRDRATHGCRGPADLR